MISEGLRELISIKRKLWMDHSGWIAVGRNFVAALDEEGMVAAAGDDSFGVLEIMNYGKLIAIDAGSGHCVGLKPDGTAVASGVGDECDVWLWTDLCWICAGADHTVGLKKDGTVVATGDNTHGQCNVNHWRNIVFIAAGGHRTVGLTSDGQILMAGEAWSEYETPPDWKNIVALYVEKGYNLAPAVYGYVPHPDNPNVEVTLTTERYPSSAAYDYAVFGEIGGMAGSRDKIFTGKICNESKAMRCAIDNVETDYVAMATFNDQGAYLTEDGKIVLFGNWKEKIEIPDEWVLFSNFATVLSNRISQISNSQAPGEEGLTYASYRKILAMIEAGKASKTLPIITKYIEYDPDNYTIWQLQGMAYKELGNFDLATQAYRKAIDLAPDVAESYMGLCDIYIKTKNPQEALKCIDAVISRKKDDFYCNKRVDLVGLAHGLDVAISACEEYRREFPQSNLLRYQYHALMIWKAVSLCRTLPSGQYAISDEETKAEVQKYLNFADSVLGIEGIQDPAIEDRIKKEWEKIRVALTSFSAEGSQKTNYKTYCTACGATLDEGDIVCPSCGKQQKYSPHTQINKPSSQTKHVLKRTSSMKKKRIVILLIAALIIIVAGCFLIKDIRLFIAKECSLSGNVGMADFLIGNAENVEAQELRQYNDLVSRILTRKSGTYYTDKGIEEHFSAAISSMQESIQDDEILKRLSLLEDAIDDYHESRLLVDSFSERFAAACGIFDEIDELIAGKTFTREELQQKIDSYFDEYSAAFVLSEEIAPGYFENYDSYTFWSMKQQFNNAFDALSYYADLERYELDEPIHFTIEPDDDVENTIIGSASIGEFERFELEFYDLYSVVEDQLFEALEKGVRSF